MLYRYATQDTLSRSGLKLKIIAVKCSLFGYGCTLHGDVHILKYRLAASNVPTQLQREISDRLSSSLVLSSFSNHLKEVEHTSKLAIICTKKTNTIKLVLDEKHEKLKKPKYKLAEICINCVCVCVCLCVYTKMHAQQ